MNSRSPRNGANAANHNLGAIALAGLASGVVDAVYFSLMAPLRGKTPIDTLWSIASFWLGPASHNGGAASALIGAATHFGLATLMALGYFILSRFVPFAPRRPLISGALYGAALYAVMYYGVLPLRWPAYYPRFDGWRSVLDIAIHLCVGVAIALIIVRTAAPREEVGPARVVVGPEGLEPPT